MQLFIKKRIGQETYTFVVEGKNLFEVVMESQKLSFDDVDVCGVCGKNHLILNARITPEDHYEYVEVKCLSCKAQLVFGRPKKVADTYYLRKDKETKKLQWKEFTPAQEDNINE